MRVDATVVLARRLKAYRKIKYITPEKFPVDFCGRLRHDSDKCWPTRLKGLPAMSAVKQKTDAQLKADLDAKNRAKEAVAAKKAAHAAELDKPIEGQAEGGLAPELPAEAKTDGQGDAFIPPAAVEPDVLGAVLASLEGLRGEMSDLEKRIDAVERGLKGLGVGAKRRVDDGTHVGSIDGLGKI